MKDDLIFFKDKCFWLDWVRIVKRGIEVIMVLKGSVKVIVYIYLILFEKKKIDVMNYGFLNIKIFCFIFL